MFSLYLALSNIVLCIAIQYNVSTPHLAQVLQANPLYTARSSKGFNVIFNPTPGHYVAFPEPRKTGCIQVLTTTFISRNYCSLPTYCKDTQYQVISSGWFSTIGVCYGLSIPVTIVSFKTVSKGYEMSLDTNGWCAVGKYINYNRTSYPDHPVNSRIRVIICNDGVYIMSKDTLSTYTQLTLHSNNNTHTLLHPTLQQSEDGRFCTPRYAQSTVPYILGPFRNEESIVANLPVFYRYTMGGRASIPRIKLDPVTTLTYITANRMVVTTHHINATEYKCEPYLHTLNILPFNVGSLFVTIVHILELVLQWTIDLVVIAFELLIEPLRNYDLFSFTSFVFVAYATYKYGNAYAISLSYFLSLLLIIVIRTMTS